MTSTPGWVTAFTACGLLCLSLLTVRVQACVVHCGRAVTRCEMDCEDLSRRSRYLELAFAAACAELEPTSGVTREPVQP